MTRFDGRVALVTGGASGIGAAAARAFAREGARVVVADLNVAGAEAVVRSIEAEGGVATAVAVDVADEASTEAMVSHAVQTFGGLHIAFNNAGIPSDLRPSFEATEPDSWRRVIDVNATGMFLCMRAEVPALKASGGSAIVNTASIAAVKAAPDRGPYVASKHAVAGLTKAAALDLIPFGIRVNAICPGFVDTAMLAPIIADDDARASLASLAPIGRIADPDEIARAVLFLASDDASYVVGSLLSVDGGLAAQ